MIQAEKQITHGPGGRVLANTGVWSSDSQWIAYDTRSDAAGEQFDGDTIAMVNVQTAEVRVLYRATNGAHCGVPIFHPRENKVAFILGPEHPTPDWRYGPSHRQGVVVRTDTTAAPINLDARDLTPPFTPGALRGGSHVHVWDAMGQWISFTYEDHLLQGVRNVGVSIPRPVRVTRDHPRNHDGQYFSVLVTRTVANPKPGSDQIKKAFEEAWVGTNHKALAFQGHVVTMNNETISEVFIVDLPDDLTQPGDGPLAGTETRMPCPPKDCIQRRLTFTAQRKFPGLQGPRHWLRSSPDGARIAFLMRDDTGIVQLWTISLKGGPPEQITRNTFDIASAFTWSPDGKRIVHVMDNSVCITEVPSGRAHRLTPRSDDTRAPRPEACVFSPDGKKIAFMRRIDGSNQIFAVPVE
ncbi:MAG TPA: DUF3748 domain-containing protein [Verrucomicrobiae bacterium]|nr:DUF3748 domain-containing protein [Verrucomicrobiae bacterium]